MVRVKLFINIFRNTIQSILILLFMAFILSIIGTMIAGKEGLLTIVIIGVFLLIVSPKVSPALILRMYRARAMPAYEAKELYRILTGLSKNAHLNYLPILYYIPSKVMNAFSIGSKKNAVIALTDGLLRNLYWNEITGVIAHEISHIKSNDLWIMGLADSLSRITNALSLFGQIMIIFYLPALLFTEINISILTIGVLFFSPVLSVVLQLALSRTREFEADINAVKLTGDPDGLVSALQKIERSPLRIWDMIFMPGRKVPDPSIIRTHPHTEKRIKRLMGLSDKESTIDSPKRLGSLLPDHYDVVTREPSWRIFGLWH